MGVLECKAADRVYEVVGPAFAQVGHWVEVGVGIGVEAGVGAGEVVVAESAPKAAAVVAVELPGPVAGAGMAAGPGLEAAEAEAGDEVEAAHMMKVVAVLVLPEKQLASGVGHTEGRLAVDIERTVDNAAGKGHIQGTSDSTAGIAIAAAGTTVEASEPVLPLVHRQLHSLGFGLEKQQRV